MEKEELDQKRVAHEGKGPVLYPVLAHSPVGALLGELLGGRLVAGGVLLGWLLGGSGPGDVASSQKGARPEDIRNVAGH